MAILKPIVINLPTRGACAVDYIDYFDEGQYGPDKLFFVGRYDTFEEASTQMNACLALQGNPGSMIHNSRHYIESKWTEPLVGPEEKYPKRAKYMIRFMFRVKFFGEYAYLEVGKKWDDTDPSSTFYITPSDLEVIDYCLFSKEDANYILENLIKPNLSSTPQTYTLNEDGTYTISELTEGAAYEYLQEKEAAQNATYLLADGIALSDKNGLLTL